MAVWIRELHRKRQQEAARRRAAAPSRAAKAAIRARCADPPHPASRAVQEAPDGDEAPAEPAGRLASAQEFNVQREVDSITDCAARGDARIVTLRELVFFSTSLGDAWMLYAEDGLAYCLMHNCERRQTPVRSESEQSNTHHSRALGENPTSTPQRSPPDSGPSGPQPASASKAQSRSALT